MKRYTVISSGSRRTELHSLTESAAVTGMHPQMIQQFVQAEYVQAAGTDLHGEPCFDETGLLRLRRIEEMRVEWGVNLRTLRHIVHLLDRLEAAEHELRMLRERMR